MCTFSFTSLVSCICPLSDYVRECSRKWTGLIASLLTKYTSTLLISLSQTFYSVLCLELMYKKPSLTLYSKVFWNQIFSSIFQNQWKCLCRYYKAHKFIGMELYSTYRSYNRFTLMHLLYMHLRRCINMSNRTYLASCNKNHYSCILMLIVYLMYATCSF